MSNSEQTTLAFDGATFDPQQDQQRLSTQFHKVWSCMRPGDWKTLPRIAEETGLGAGCTPGISARLRDFRKRGFTVDRRRVAGGLWEYRLIVKEAQSA